MEAARINAYFPFFIDIKSKKLVIVGGGTIALRKLEKLMSFGGDITVVAPEICDEILGYNVKIIKRDFSDGDIDGAFCVISATDDENLNAHIFNLCQEREILVNTVDDREKCGFIFPSLINKNGVTAGITTSGKSPIYAKYIRERLEAELNKISPDTVGYLWKYRSLVKEKVGNESGRKSAFEKMLGICLSGGVLDDENVLKIIGEINDYEDKNRNEKE